jgi:hypothetical protein
MARTVFYQMLNEPDGTLSAVVTIEPDQSLTRVGFRSLAEAMEWVDGLRILMAACGAPLVCMDKSVDVAMIASTESKPPLRIRHRKYEVGRALILG